MRFGMGLSRPPPLVKRHKHTKEVGYRDSFDRPPPALSLRPGKRDLPLPPKPRRSPFRPILEDDFEGNDIYDNQSYATRPRSKSSGRSSSRRERSPSTGSGDKWSRSSSRGGRGSMTSQGRAVQLQVQDPEPYTDWYDDDDDDDDDDERETIKYVKRGESYRGGYDFRDDVDSIDTREETERQRRRREQARQQEARRMSEPSPTFSSIKQSSRYGSRDAMRPPPSPVSSLRKMSRYESPDSVRTPSPQVSSLRGKNRYEYGGAPAERSRGSSHREKMSSFRGDGGTLASSIATNEDDLTLDRTISTFTQDSYTNPQYLHARSLPELPPGYLQRKDGVVISIGSSLASGRDERYADASPFPEVAAEEVVENLRAFGYKVDDKNGIIESDSSSGHYSKYGGDAKSSTQSMGVVSSRSKVRSESRGLKTNPSSTHTAYGSRSSPSVASRAKITGSRGSAVSSSSGEGSVNLNKIRSSSNDAKSSSSRKYERKPSTDARSSGSRRQQRLEMIVQTLEEAKNMAKKELDANGSSSEESQSDCDSKASTSLAEGSTFTSRADDTIDRRRGQVVIDMKNTQLVGSVSSGPTSSDPTPITPSTPSTPPVAENNMKASVKQVDFSGEYPETTKSGDRVPELVTNLPDLSTAISDLSHQRSLGLSTLSSATFLNKQQASLAGFCDKLLYSCRISAFPTTTKESQ